MSLINPCPVDLLQHGGSCESETVTCSLPDLTPGATANVKVVISNRFPETLINTVTVSTQEYPTDVKKTWTHLMPVILRSLFHTPNTFNTSSP
ncbi:MAG TPA: hypothetical protein EYP59_10400 [Thiotrichaceae bacterium]|nr:hypothetical protein [Thiotrichaceae bacterium]